ncbi:hypothetical protein CES86_0248 [Brucella lupini]|uniref:Uncharacterized protein n=1 Tax=Brucella lupini TaxID=255457 RepID=A0A256GYN9_9HYPH|nr:hypothetical protein CES86_0248 [Brucella lupini]
MKMPESLPSPGISVPVLTHSLPETVLRFSGWALSFAAL